MKADTVGERKTLEFYNLAIEIKEHFKREEIELTDTVYGRLAILIQKNGGDLHYKLVFDEYLMQLTHLFEELLKERKGK